MRYLTTIILLFIITNCFAQDSIFHGKRKFITLDNKIEIDIATDFTQAFDLHTPKLNNSNIKYNGVKIIFDSFHKFFDSSIFKKYYCINDSIYYHLVMEGNNLSLAFHVFNPSLINDTGIFFIINANTKLASIISFNKFAELKNSFYAKRGIIDSIYWLPNNNNQTVYNYCSVNSLKGYLENCKDYSTKVRKISELHIYFGLFVYDATKKGQYSGNDQFVQLNSGRITTIIYPYHITRNQLGNPLFWIQTQHLKEFNNPCPTQCNKNYPYSIWEH